MTARTLRHHDISYFYQPGNEHHFAGRALVLAFLCGVSLYQWRDRTLYDDRIGLACLLGGLVLASFISLQYVAVAPLAYATIWIGLKPIPRTWIIDRADYSYGVYLFAAPIQQMLATFEPLRFWWMNFSIGLSTAVLYAMFSWRFIEKPALDRKSTVVKAVNRWGEQMQLQFGRKRPSPEST